MWVDAGLGAALGLAAYAIANEGAFALTQRLDPTMATLVRNRYIAGAVLTAGGLALAAFESPVLGTGLAAGGLAALAGVQLVGLLGKVLDKPAAATPAAAPLQAQTNPTTTKGIFGTDGRQQFQGIFNPMGQQTFQGLFNAAGQQSFTGNQSDPWDGVSG